VRTPIAGGNSLALAMARLKGSANKKTRNPENMSALQFCFNPAKPSLGTFINVFMTLLNGFDPIPSKGAT
jgi:hypothetical protein